MSTAHARPHGVGVAVVFDWALTVQLSVQALAAATGHLGLRRDPAAIAGRCVAALLVLALGEAVRRGVRTARVLQVALMVLISVLGVVSLVLLLGGGDRALILSAAIELTYAPWLVWRLSMAQTVEWFDTSRGHGVAPYTSGRVWVAVLAAWSLAWGVAVAWSQSLS